MMLLLLLYLTNAFILILKHKIEKPVINFSINIYFGWIAVATIANIAAYLTKLNIFDISLHLGICLLMIAVAAALNFIFAYKFRNYVFACVGIWALFAIGIRYIQEPKSLFIACLISILVIVSGKAKYSKT